MPRFRLPPFVGFTFLLGACASLSAGDPELYQSLDERDVSLASRLLQETLETAPDGATRTWHNQESGRRGSVTPTRTYLSESGRFCRDYREELTIGERDGRFYHTACRDETLGWVWL